MMLSTPSIRTTIYINRTFSSRSNLWHTNSGDQQVDALIIRQGMSERALTSEIELNIPKQ